MTVYDTAILQVEGEGDVVCAFHTFLHGHPAAYDRGLNGLLIHISVGGVGLDIHFRTRSGHIIYTGLKIESLGGAVQVKVYNREAVASEIQFSVTIAVSLGC